MNYRSSARAVVAASLLVALSGVARGEIIEQVLVKVNGEIFTKTDLEARQVAVLRQKGQFIDPKTDPNNEQLRKALNEITPQLMVDVVNEMVIVQRGRDLGYKLSDEQFKSVLENIKKENKIETEEQWQAVLKQENMTMADLRRQLERSMIVQRVQQNEVLSKIAVTEDEARRYYGTHKNEFTTPPSVTLREVLVAVPTDGKALNVGVDEAAKEKAEGLRQRVQAGESVEKIASEISEAPSRANAGLIGPISLNDVSPDLRKIIEGTKVGDITPVIRTPRGYQFFKLESSTPTQTLAFDQAREQISDRVFTDKRRQEFDKYLAKLRSEAIIDWRNDEVKRAFEAGLAEEAKQTAAAPAQ